MSGMDRLLPCPFCGGAPTLALGNGAYGVNCRCKGEAFIQTYGGGFVTTGFTREQAKENAIAAWNRRASQTAPAQGWEACTCGPCPLHPAAPAPSDGLRERAEAAEAERDRQYDENVHRIAMQARAENERDEARRAEAAAWNDAIEAAVKPPRDAGMEKCGGEGWLWRHEMDIDPNPEAQMQDDTRYSCDCMCCTIRVLRRAAPTEGEA